MTTWVPQSCTLPTTEQPLRVAEFDALFAERLTEVYRPGRLRLDLVLEGGSGVEETVRDLVARESDCCSFFSFTTSADTGGIRLGVEVDSAHEATLDAVQARAAQAAGTEQP
ncbi:hypothetical protein [Streptomyces sp. KR55]|uniref:hypothetical protein n=1 Tax=Streptomyces sp. KR55 TaxID=3457425 RepID=UPI003FD5F59E